jgi:hypothetical protein
VYAASIVEQRLETVSETVGFRVEYHTPSEIDEFNRQLERKYEAQYAEASAEAQGAQDYSTAFQNSLYRSLCNPSKPLLNADEVRFIENERAILMADAAYFLTRYYWLKDRQNVIRRFAFQGGQRVLFDVIAEIEMCERAIELILAKARQLGMSTLVEGLMLHKAAFTYGAHSVIASADQDKLGLMSQMMFLGYDYMPWYLRPATSRRVTSARGMIVFGGMQSAVSFQHGSQKNPIAMGSTPIAWHLSEVSSFIDAYDLIEVGLFKAVHPSPRVFGIAESTAKGDTGWFHDTYWHAKAKWALGESRLMALFLPFYMADDMYPNPSERRSHPVPEGWRPDDETRRMIAESELYVASNPVLQKALGTNWTMPREKAHFWEWQYAEACAKGGGKKHLQELPHTDKAAFQGSFDNVFGREIVAEAYTKRSTSYAVYGIVGQSIEARHEPEEEDFDYSLPRIPVTYSSRKGGGHTYRWEFIPLNYEEWWDDLDELKDAEDHFGKLFVWLPPEKGYDYAIGIDTSNGLSEDNTCISVARRGRTPQEPDVQAAEFRSPDVSHVEAFAWAMAIAAYYSKYMAETTMFREPYVAVEQLMAVGDTVQLQMSNMGYSRFHKMTRYDSEPRFMRKSQSRKRGWFTTMWSRPMLTDGFVTFVINGWYVVNSPWTMYEMDHWEVHLTAGGREKKEHSAECTDDGIFANAMCAFCPNDRQTLAKRTAKRLGDPRSNLPKVDLGNETGIVIGREDFDRNWEEEVLRF